MTESTNPPGRSANRSPQSHRDASQTETESLELRLFLEAIYERYGYDFRDYARSSLKRRLTKCMTDAKVETISEFQARVLHSPENMEQFILAMSIDVTGLFRDPNFYAALRNKAVPVLRSLPFIRIWSAGCSTGEEVYSLAILLEEEGLYDHCRIYATDFNEVVLQKAKAGVFPMRNMKAYTASYQQAGGTRSFSEYYTAKYDNALMRTSLQKNILWAQHNLVTDASFNEFHLILCRNVMIYFNQSLSAQVHELIYESLAPGGFLGLGSSESIKFTRHESDYEVMDAKEKLFRRKDQSAG
ncbi:MAG: chemotaxis protein CheR [Anaerolinea sp.]|nr:chemotaxis protein CheR [Anaerolinea sp.]